MYICLHTLRRARDLVMNSLTKPSVKSIKDARDMVFKILQLPGGWMSVRDVTVAMTTRSVLVPLLLETVLVMDAMIGNWTNDVVALYADERFSVYTVRIICIWMVTCRRSMLSTHA